MHFRTAKMQLVLPPLVAMVITLLCVEEIKCQSSLCQSHQYRSLSIQVQNEYLCMSLEQIHGDLTTQTNKLMKKNDDLYSLVDKLHSGIYKKLQASTEPRRDSAKTVPLLKDIPLVHDCDELLFNGITKSGVYAIRMPDRNIVNIWCDMDTDHGGWTIIQRRIDGTTNFARYWDDYMFGFGNANTEYWIGNQNLHLMTDFKNYSLRFDLWDWDGNKAYALYDGFQVSNEKDEFRLKLGKYSGTAGDALSKHSDGMKFSTIERDNDKWTLSCAKKDQSGWWFKSCGHASPNGLYIEGGHQEITPDGLIKGMTWYPWKKILGYSMKRIEMKIKPSGSVHATISTTTTTTTTTTEAPSEETTTTNLASDNYYDPDSDEADSDK